MEDLKKDLSELLNKSEWTEEENKWLLYYLERSETSELQALMQQQFEAYISGAQINPNVSRQILQRIHQRIGEENKKKKATIVKMWILKIAAAACVISLLFLASYIWLYKGNYCMSSKETFL